jgi:hypothetical protein
VLLAKSYSELRVGSGRLTFSKSSWSFFSVSRSSSVGFGGMFAAEANCEYVWNKLSV